MITVQTIINQPIEKVWECWNTPNHIQNWCFASSDWHCPKATNDLRIGGKFSTTMAAKDGSFGFDFEGIYSQVVQNQCISYDLEDGRKVNIRFEQTPEGVKITEDFDPETENAPELQQAGWQAILNHFKTYVDGLN
jgi:uncharacterized protein YndB with AHSA1/START domain